MRICTPQDSSKSRNFNLADFCPSIPCARSKVSSSSEHAPIERFGISDDSVPLAKTYFYGPIPEASRQRTLIPARKYLRLIRRTPGRRRFSITTSARILAGSAMRYGSGTSLTRRACRSIYRRLAAGLTLWKPSALPGSRIRRHQRQQRIYKIAKESEEIPIQYAPSRTVGGSLKFHSSRPAEWQLPRFARGYRAAFVLCARGLPVVFNNTSQEPVKKWKANTR